MKVNFKVNKKLLIIVVLIVFALSGLLVGWQKENNQAVLAYNDQNLIRFHVIPNSNTAEDQLLKYQVRDKIVKTMAGRFENVQEISEARSIINEGLEDIKDLAIAELRIRGYDYPVSVYAGDYDFPTVTYNIAQGKAGEVKHLTLSEGTYEAVRVVIGEGKGDNWWCVLFPPLCFVDIYSQQSSTSNIVSEDKNILKTESGSINYELESCTEAFKLDIPHVGNIDKNTETGETDNIEYRFRILELYEQTYSWLSRIRGLENKAVKSGC